MVAVVEDTVRLSVLAVRKDSGSYLVVFLVLEKQFKHWRYGLHGRGGDHQVFLDVAQACGVAKGGPLRHGR